MQNPFDVVDSTKLNIQKKKERAAEIKALLLQLSDNKSICDMGKVEIDKLKEEQYALAKEL